MDLFDSNSMLDAALDEKNERVKDQLKKKIVEYLARAEKLKEIIDQDARKKPVAVGGGNGDGGSRNGRGGEASDDEGGSGEGSGKNKKEDADTKRMKDALSSVIVSEKPNVHWEDIAGLVSRSSSSVECAF